MSRYTPSSTPQHTMETACVHGVHSSDRETGSRAVPIYQTTSCVLAHTEEAAHRFDLDRAPEAA